MSRPATRCPDRLEHAVLSRRESEVVRALAAGSTNAEIAADLCVTLSTVKTHVSHVQAKLSARNRVEIAAWAWEHGLVRRACSGGCAPGR